MEKVTEYIEISSLWKKPRHSSEMIVRLKVVTVKGNFSNFIKLKNIDT